GGGVWRRDRAPGPPSRPAARGPRPGGGPTVGAGVRVFAVGRGGVAGAHEIVGVGADEAVARGDVPRHASRAAAPGRRPAIEVPVDGASDVDGEGEGGDFAAYEVIDVRADEAVARRDGTRHATRAAAPGR